MRSPSLPGGPAAGAGSGTASRPSSGERAPPRRLARRLAIPLTSAAVMFAALISLGVWQIHRLAWKEAILAAIDRAEAAPPVPLPPGPSPFTKVSVTGTLLGERGARYGSEVRDLGGTPAIGSQLLEVLDRPGGEPVLIDLGWLPDSARDARVSGPAEVTGFVRAPETAGLLSATDDPAARRFYTLNAAAIGHALGIAQIAPDTLVALSVTPAHPPSGPVPAPASALPRPPNDHLSYAITWFSLALVLLVITAVWLRNSGAAARADAEGTPQRRP